MNARIASSVDSFFGGGEAQCFRGQIEPGGFKGIDRSDATRGWFQVGFGAPRSTSSDKTAPFDTGLRFRVMLDAYRSGRNSNFRPIFREFVEPAVFISRNRPLSLCRTPDSRIGCSFPVESAIQNAQRTNFRRKLASSKSVGREKRNGSIASGDTIDPR